jgi:rhodanese-related sulfurtransferase
MESPRTEPVPQVTVDEFEPVVERREVIVDVRMPDEYEEAHVPGAILLPLPELPDRFGEIPDSDVVHVICRSGARSHKACEFLMAQGRAAVNVAGGTLAWLESGRSTVSGTERG